MPFRIEVSKISGNNDKPHVLPLSLGSTVILLCAGLRIFIMDERFLSHCNQSGVKIGILVSAWNNGFKDAIDLMRTFKDKTNLIEGIIVDRFKGLIGIKEG